MAPRTSATRTQISRTPRRFGTELPVYLSPPQWAEREAAGFATRNGFKSTKRQTPSSSIASYRCLPNLVRPMHRGQKLGFVLQAPDENKELLGFVSQIGLSTRYSGCFLPARLDPLQLGDRVVQHSVYHGFVPHLVFESFRRQEEMIRHGIHFGVTRSYRVRFRIGFSRSLEIVALLGESSGNLPGFITYHSAQPPGPHCDRLHPTFLEPAYRLIVFMNGGI